MKNHDNLNGAILAILCLIAGLMSPSNGFDSAKAIPASELIMRLTVIIASALLIYGAINLVQKFKVTFKKQS